ncbi:5-oxoprolinase subunit C family protein [Paractinoplanes durhamensis]|uniref:Allophanate hydrolase n=1 Tax=Paractinoplanes durhamensis TaxID=113563 RepID=A0ABQ3ZCF3_9ACTN|nr:biotin-dependent carboxyltransferase family protein [Actinoplanes durhamensis]GIE07502.1 allophanate hydrolase [Actinoplanes durhamensis]
MITVVRSGPLTTVQDLGRPGYAHLGVPRSGALDQVALRRANALVGNPVAAAGLETTLMGCALRFERAARVAVTGAIARVRIDREAVDGEVFDVPAGAVLDIGRATRGVRSYLAVAGGIDVEPVLGSRSTDTLSGLGPAKLSDGLTLPIGQVTGEPATIAGAGQAVDELLLGVRPGPRDDWFAAGELFGTAYTVSPVSNRVGCRLAGSALTRTRAGELPSEGVVLGAVQVPADGQPLIFLADHPTTGGYPVIGVVDDVTPLAQARPGSTVRFRALD